MRMLQTRSIRLIGSGFIAIMIASAISLGAEVAPASATIYPCFEALPGYNGIPPWGFHTSQPLTGDTGWYSRAYGDYDFSDDRISGELCQAHYVRGKLGTIVLGAESPMISHTHYSHKWGYPGNEILAHVKVLSSTDKSCKVGTVGVLDMYASYNGVRSDSVQYVFPKACAREDHTYHGPQVNAQVPPL